MLIREKHLNPGHSDNTDSEMICRKIMNEWKKNGYIDNQRKHEIRRYSDYLLICFTVQGAQYFSASWIFAVNFTFSPSPCTITFVREHRTFNNNLYGNHSYKFFFFFLIPNITNIMTCIYQLISVGAFAQINNAFPRYKKNRNIHAPPISIII